MSIASVLLLLALLTCASVSYADKIYRVKAPVQKPPLCLVKLKPNEQCGGTGGSCSKYRYDLKKCQDAPYQKACCPRGYACLRYNEGWRDCKPVKQEKPRGLPPLSKIPKKSELPAPVYINSKVSVNGKPKHRYLLLKYLTDWYTAEAICQYYYGLHLASIHDVGELWRVNNRCFAQMRDMCWVGANDLQMRNIFRWTDGSSWDFAFWQQNGGTSTTPAERCVALQDGFQTWPCNTKWAIACQVY